MPSGHYPSTNEVAEEALDWLRNNTPVIDNVDETTLESLANLAGVPMLRGHVSPEKKKDLIDKIVNWLRNNDIKPEDWMSRRCSHLLESLVHQCLLAMLRL